MWPRVTRVLYTYGERLEETQPGISGWACVLGLLTGRSGSVCASKGRCVCAKALDLDLVLDQAFAGRPVDGTTRVGEEVYGRVFTLRMGQAVVGRHKMVKRQRDRTLPEFQ